MKYRKILNVIFLVIALASLVTAQEKVDGNQDEKPCFQDNEEKMELVEKAENEEFNIKYIEIVGNTYSRYKSFLKKFGSNKNYPFNEGDIFRKASLFKAIEGFNKVKTIYPITTDDVRVWLQETEIENRTIKQINFTFCVKQKPQNNYE